MQVWVESQLAAVPEDPSDELLLRWRKLEAPCLGLPPSHLQLTGWRDPFVLSTTEATATCGGDGGGGGAGGGGLSAAAADCELGRLFVHVAAYIIHAMP